MEGLTTSENTATLPPAASGSLNTPRLTKHKRRTAQLVRKLSEDSLQSPVMAPEFVVIEVKDEESGATIRKTVYVTDQNGTQTLDLYSGWNPESQKHKLPLKALPMKVCQLTSLERLWVSHNKLSSLPGQLSQLTNLKEVFLHRNNFEEFPICLCGLPCLELLWLNNNKIKSIPEDIAKLTSLKRLHLDCNFIKYLPEGLCELNQLEVLYLNHNTIHHISETIGKLHLNLKRLYLQNNKITELPNGITKLSNLIMLLLDDNEIRSVKREFTQYQAHMESIGSIVSLKNNPFVTPHSKLKTSKLSLVGIGPSPVPLVTRRLSDQYERDVTRRPMRVSLPASASADTLDRIEFKADTLPRSHTGSFIPKKRTSNEQ